MTERRGVVPANPGISPKAARITEIWGPMLSEQSTEDRPNRGPATVGLEILYAKLRPEDPLGDVARRNLDGELRERYWIRQAQDAGIRKGKSWTDIGFSVPWSTSKSLLSRPTASWCSRTLSNPRRSQTVSPSPNASGGSNVGSLQKPEQKTLNK